METPLTDEKSRPDPATPPAAAPETATQPLDFIRKIVMEDQLSGKWAGQVVTRFPPEPNGYLHIGHAKSICLNFGIAREFNGRCHLRFDDTNPSKEETEYVDSIMEDVRWLGFDWGDHLYYASDYFEQLYGFAIALIKNSSAFICDLTAEQMRQSRGTLTKPGVESPFRSRSVEENLDLFTRMRAGEFDEGTRTLRAKIDMASPNINMRDPVLYRIMRAHHHRTGDMWCIYPMYDYAHPISDSIEGVTHSLCTLEFEAHRPLYDWCLKELGIHHSQQTEFARLNITYTLMSKRKLLELVREGHVRGWDDPRMPTISGIRRRGYTPESIRDFASRVGVAKNENVVELGYLEACLREDLNKRALRVMAVLRPIKVVITNYPEGQSEDFDAVNNPEDATAGSRKVPFSRTLFIEQDDFMETPANKFFRLSPGKEVRLRYAYWIRCEEVVKDASGNITEVRCTYDPETRGGNNPPDGRKVKATIHWVSAEHALATEVRLYDTLFTRENPEEVPEGLDWRANLNPGSLEVVPDARVEPGLVSAKAGDRFQFERLGYFAVDPDSTPGRPIFNRSVGLKDTWARVQQKA
ncbi:MAG: glutamine--tRNA ligase/YqeY domain fusion protein [Candidatus Sumerlaeaceae bacterium]